ncbi:MAG TPA: acyl-CoA dehydrogenase [Polyangiaceae bacterium]|nr:acyl-CoA dehydrogenase [Polyangiaceae bacterium]
MTRALTDLSDDERMIQESVLGFARERVAPRVREMDESAKMDPGLVRELFELGVMGTEIPEAYGGAGSTFFSAILAVEALATVDPSVSVLLDVQNTLVVNTLLRWGNEEQKTRYLPKLASEWVGSYALSESESGSDAFGLKTRAVREGDGYRLSGNKLWITNAAESELFIVFATVDPALGYKGITAFLVERSAPGFHVEAKEKKLGIRASSTCPLTLDGVLVPDAQVLGQVGQGYKVAIETLNEGRIGIGAQMVGLAQGALDHAVAHVKQRKQFGKALAEFQAVQFQLAELRARVEAARLLVYNAARLKDSGRPFVGEAAIAKLLASEAAEEVASKAVELLGGVGFTQEYPVEKLYRDAKIGKIYEGTSNMQLQTIAKLLLGA